MHPPPPHKHPQARTHTCIRTVKPVRRITAELRGSLRIDRVDAAECALNPVPLYLATQVTQYLHCNELIEESLRKGLKKRCPLLRWGRRI